MLRKAYWRYQFLKNHLPVSCWFKILILYSSPFLLKLREFKRSYRVCLLGEFHVPTPTQTPSLHILHRPWVFVPSEVFFSFFFFQLKISKPFYRFWLYLFENKQSHHNHTVKNFRDLNRFLEIFLKRDGRLRTGSGFQNCPLAGYSEW